MSRDFLRGLVIGGLLAASMLIGLVFWHDSVQVAEVREREAITERKVRQLEEAARSSEAALKEQRTLSRGADSIAVRAVGTREKVRQVATSITSRRDTVVPSDSGDTTQMATITRRSDTTRSWRIPQFVVDDRNFLISAATLLDSAYNAERAARLFADSITIPALQSELRASRGLTDAVVIERDWWKAKKTPWCGRRCGMAIGVGGTLLAAYALSEVLGVLPDPTKREALHVPAFHLRF